MTDDVAALVLRDNYFQTQVLSVTGRIAPQLLDAQQRFIQFLEKGGRLNRAIEFLPSDEEIAERRARGRGLTAPGARGAARVLQDLAVRRAARLAAARRSVGRHRAVALFPAGAARALRGATCRAIRCKREIIATHVINSMINRVGSTFVHRLMETTGAKPDEIVRAYLLTREIFGFVPLWQAIEALDNKVDDAVQSEMLIDSTSLLERGTTWFLRSRRLTDDMAATIAHFTPGVEALATQLPSCSIPPTRRASTTRSTGYVANGVPQPVAARVVALPTLYSTLDIVEVADTTRRPVELVARIYFELSTRLGVPWLRERIAALPADQHWQMLAQGGDAGRPVGPAAHDRERGADGRRRHGHARAR